MAWTMNFCKSQGCNYIECREIRGIVKKVVIDTESWIKFRHIMTDSFVDIQKLFYEQLVISKTIDRRNII